MKLRTRITSLITLLALVLSVPTAMAAVSDLPGISTATSMKDWLKLSDDQVAKLTPVLQTRIDKMDAALTKLDSAEEPDFQAFLGERKAIRDEFDAGVNKILTPDQLKQWESFKAEAEKSLVGELAASKLRSLKAPLGLTDDQMTKLLPAMTVATQGKLDELQRLANTGRIGANDKIKAKRTMGEVNGNLEKAMAGVLSQDQIATYKEIQEEQKAKVKEAMKKK